MKHLFLISILLGLLLPVVSHAKFKGSYQVGTLKAVDLERVTRVSSISHHHHHHFGFGHTTYVRPNAHTVSYYYIVVQVDDLVYTAQYSPNIFKTYRPSTWVVNDPVQVGFDYKYMYVKRPDGKDLKAKIIKKVRVKK